MDYLTSKVDIKEIPFLCKCSHFQDTITTQSYMSTLNFETTRSTYLSAANLKLEKVLSLNFRCACTALNDHKLDAVMHLLINFIKVPV